ncbi:MAG: CSLREA domain-containing protein [Solirubrobacterales bacterium]
MAKDVRVPMRRWVLAISVVALLASPGVAVAATIKVTTTDDELVKDGDCSLREAMISANNNVGRDACKKGEGRGKTDVVKLANVEYTLSLTGSEDENLTGDLDYMGGGKLTILGAAADTEIDAGPSGDRVIHADENAKALRIERVALEDGSAGDGGLIHVRAGSLVLDRVMLTNGKAATLGGGLYFDSDGSFKIKRSDFIASVARGGGGIYADAGEPSLVSKSTFVLNRAQDGASRGGGAWFAGEAVDVVDSTFTKNDTTAPVGGASFGAGIFGEDVRVARSLFDGNEAEEMTESVPAVGGAMLVTGDSSVTNSTFYDNSSADTGGGFAGEGKLSHVTFLLNQADDAGDHISSSSGDGIVLRNSILPGAAIAVDVCAGDDVVSKGFNVFTYDDFGCGTLDSDVTNGGNAGLAPGEPVDNGGPTETIALTADSIAKDLIPKSKCKSAKGVDQRGFKRPKGPRCDAGSFERGAQPE